MKERHIDCGINWIEEELAGIVCPYCREEVSVGIYREDEYRCKCGKRFRLIQSNTVVEIIENT